MAKLGKKQVGGFAYSTFAPSHSLEPEGNTHLPPHEVSLGIRREKKGRAGKTVTLVLLPENMPEQQAQDLGQLLRKHCGTGGSNTPDAILLQGDFVEKVLLFLKNQGFKSKKIGG